MPDFITSCDGAAPDGPTSFFALTVQSDGEDYHSRVMKVENLNDPTRIGLSEVYYRHSWLQCIWRSPDGGLFLGDEEGATIQRESTRWVEHQLPTQTPVVSIWGSASDNVFAAGDAGIVFHWDGSKWEAVSEALGEKIFSGAISPDGTMYVCGQRGSFWFHKDDAWHRIELPTNARLTGICVLENADVLVCGEKGVLYRGSLSSWESLELTETDLHGVCAFQDAIYLAGSTDGIYQLDNDGLQLVKDNVISYGVVADKSGMISFGDKIAIQYDGTRWSGMRFD